MSEIVRGGILAVDPGQFEAATALGMTHGQTIVVPTGCSQYLATTGMNLLLTSRDTSVFKCYSVVELTLQGNTVATQKPLLPLPIIMIYFVLTFTHHTNFATSNVA